MISYYELLGMIKNVNFPEKVKYDGHIYVWNGRNYRAIETDDYLSDYIDEVDMIEQNIEIIENDKQIKKLSIPCQESTIANNYSKDNIQCVVNEFYRRFSVLINKTNEIIEVLNEKEKIQDNQK